MGKPARSRYSLRMRRLLFVLIALPLFVAGWCFIQARADPVTRHATVRLPDWPAGARPVRVLLWSDLHLGNASTGRGRLERLVAQADALRPDLVVLAGDFVSTEAADADDLLLLKKLHAPFGLVAVLGNHDHWTDASRVRAALERAGITVLDDQAVRLGPLAVGGLGDWITRHASIGRTAAAMRRAGGSKLLISHTPEVAVHLPRDIPLLIAGHTHCGQVVLPGYGPPVAVTVPRNRCGLVREGGRLTVVTAGTGTSVIPFRLGAHPDWWLLTLGP